MEKNSEKQNHFGAGLALLAAAACLCVKGLGQVEDRLKEKTEKKS